MIKCAVTMTVAVVMVTAPALAQDRIEEVLERLANANAHRDHVMVVANRSSRWMNGEIELAANSLSAIDRAVELGVEMVELDVQRTADGEYVILPDGALDRTTTCSGAVAEQLLAELQECRLVVEATGDVTDEPVLSLREAYAAIAGRVLLGVDIDLGVDDLATILAIAAETGVGRQIVVRRRVDTSRQIDATRRALRTIGFPLHFMPVLDDRQIKDLASAETVYREFAPTAIEVIVGSGENSPTVVQDGVLFSDPAMALAERYDTHVWVDTSIEREDVWQGWVEAGATILGTDEPEALVTYLEERGYRRPYE